MAFRKKRRQVENDTVAKPCDRLLSLAGWWVIPWRNRGVPIGTTGRWMFRGLKGVPDRLCVRGGEVVAVEYKSKTGTQSDTQEAFQRRWEGNGLRYFLVRSPEDLKALR